MRVIVFIAMMLAIAYASPENHWAVLVAGSDGYWNYRHQSDICHAYQIMKSHGIPESQIIVIAKDDIAQNSRNPFPGKIFNQPNGKDVYEGCKIDYSGEHTTPEIFHAIMRGDSAAVAGKGTGKVLKSTSADKVFINYSDHGSNQLLAMPKGYLYAKDLQADFEFMHENKMYHEMVVYIEACHAGSMFDGILPENINVYATTASHPHESSWGYYCSPQDVVDGKHIGSCLGDEYSIHWMEDSDVKDLCEESLQEQTDLVRTETTKSHVMEYGSLKFRNEVVGNFQGVCDREPMVKPTQKRVMKQTEEFAALDSRDIKLHYLFNNYATTKTLEDLYALQHELEKRAQVESRFLGLKAKSANSFNFSENGPAFFDQDCYKMAVEHYTEKCGQDEEDLKYFQDFASLCESKSTPFDVVRMMIDQMC